MLNDVSTVVLFLELHRRLAQYSTGEISDQLFADIEQSNSKAFCDLDISLHSAFTAHATTIMQRVADDENT